MSLEGPLRQLMAAAEPFAQGRLVTGREFSDLHHALEGCKTILGNQPTELDPDTVDRTGMWTEGQSS